MTTTEGTEMTTARGYSAILENVNLTVKGTVEKILRINFYLDADAGTGEVSGFKAWDHIPLPSSHEDAEGIQNFRYAVDQFIADAEPVRDHMRAVFAAVYLWRESLVGERVLSQEIHLIGVLNIIRSKFDVIDADIETMKKIQEDPYLYLNHYFEDKEKKEVVDSAAKEKRMRREEDIALVLASAPEDVI